MLVDKIQTICFVVSPSGLGHMSRQIALAKELLLLDHNSLVKFVCTYKQKTRLGIDFFSFAEVEFIEIPNTRSLIMSSIDLIDFKSTLDSFQKGFDINTQIREDVDWTRILYGCDLIINDIECIHNPIAKKLSIPIVNISNFTWSDIIKSIGNNQLALNYASLERMADYHFQLPFSTDCMGFENAVKIGLLSRSINWEEVRKIKSLSKNPLILISHPSQKIKQLCQNIISLDYTPVLAERLGKYCEDLEILTYADNEANTQNFIAAADIVIGKTGYSLTSEIFAGGTYFLHWIRSGYVEDIVLSTEIIRQKYGELIKSNTGQLVQKQIDSIRGIKLERRKNETSSIAKRIYSIMINNVKCK